MGLLFLLGFQLPNIVCFGQTFFRDRPIVGRGIFSLGEVYQYKFKAENGIPTAWDRSTGHRGKRTTFAIKTKNGIRTAWDRSSGQPP